MNASAELEELVNLCEGAGKLAEVELIEDAFVATRGDKRAIKVWTGEDGRSEWTPEYAAYITRNWRFDELMEAGAHSEAAMMLVDDRALWAIGSMEEGPFCRLCWPQPDGGFTGGYFEGQAETVPLSICAAALKALATEARRAETVEQGSVHEGAGRDSDNAQNTSPPPRKIADD